MNKKNKLALVIFFAIDAIFLILVVKLTGAHPNFAVFNTKGVIATKERNLLLTATAIMLCVAIPVFVALFWFAYKYRAGNRQAEYRPDWEGTLGWKLLWWAVPTAVIAIIGVINWKSTHTLDPYKPLASNKPPLNIEVVSLQWKWLFIYPQQNIAVVNFVEFPESTPLSFALTSDAPMNSFWIPQLGGQMYTMPGMESHLHLMANGPGSFTGSDAEISGAGFASMRFVAKAVSQAEFDQWVKNAQQSAPNLTLAEYNQLAEPSSDTPVTIYKLDDQNLYSQILDKYMGPPGQSHHHN